MRYCSAVAILVILLIAAGFAWMFRYELGVPAGQGVYVLDRFTGHVYWVSAKEKVRMAR